MASREILACGQEEGTKLWEIQKFPYVLAWLEPVEGKQYGRFHEKYSYVMLNTAADKSYTLSIWDGKESQAGCQKDARDATKMLKKHLKVPDLEVGVQKQGEETEDFKSHFLPNGIRYDSFDKEKQEAYDEIYKRS